MGKLNIAEIIEKNGIKQVYSVIHDKMCDVTLDFDDEYLIHVNDGLYCIEFTNDGSYGKQLNNCLIWPSKEEQTWELYRVKEKWMPCESDEQFISLYFGKTVKNKSNGYFRIVDTLDNILNIRFWYECYNLLDGQPLGIKTTK